MISGWLSVPIPGVAVSAELPEPHRARYSDRINSLPPETTLSVVAGAGETELNSRARYFEAILIRNRVFDVVLLDMVAQ